MRLLRSMIIIVTLMSTLLQTSIANERTFSEILPNQDFNRISQGDVIWEIANRYEVGIDEVNSRQKLLTEGIEINQFQSEKPLQETIDVIATAYTAYCKGCIGITKTGVDLRGNPEAKVIAVDPDVIPLGSKVYIEGHGYAQAEDTGGAIKGNRIDIFIPSREDALQWGVQEVKVHIIE